MADSCAVISELLREHGSFATYCYATHEDSAWIQEFHSPLSLMLSFGFIMATTSTVGRISSSISSVGLYAIGDSSSVPVQTDDE